MGSSINVTFNGSGGLTKAMKEQSMSSDESIASDGEDDSLREAGLLKIRTAAVAYLTADLRGEALGNDPDGGQLFRLNLQLTGQDDEHPGLIKLIGRSILINGPLDLEGRLTFAVAYISLDCIDHDKIDVATIGGTGEGHAGRRLLSKVFGGSEKAENLIQRRLYSDGDRMDEADAFIADIVQGRAEGIPQQNIFLWVEPHYRDSTTIPESILYYAWGAGSDGGEGINLEPLYFSNR